MKTPLLAHCCLVIAGLGNGTSPTLGADWQQFGFNAAHTSWNDAEPSLATSNVVQLKLAWTALLKEGAATSATAGDGRIFVAHGGNISALDAPTGKVLWSHLFCSGIGTVQPALGASALFVGDAGGDLASYDPGTGESKWCRDLGGSISWPPAVDGAEVYICNGSELVAVDQATGDSRWRFQPTGGEPLQRTPAVSGQSVYVCSDAVLFAVDRASGGLLWRASPGSTLSPPAVLGTKVYLGGQMIYAFNAGSGAIEWTNRAVGVNVSMPCLAEGRVFVNAQDPEFGLTALDAEIGGVLWHSQMPGETSAAASVGNGIVFDLTEDGQMLMFDTRDGRLLGQIADPNGRSFASGAIHQPTISGAQVIVPIADVPGQIDSFALPGPPSLSVNRLAGQVALSWRAEIEATVQSSPTLGTDSHWSPVTNAPSVTSGEHVLKLPIGSGTRYYRLLVP